MKSIWSGALSFGLVNIPVNLYSASESVRLNLDWLHKKDMSQVRYAKVCKHEEKEIEMDEIVKGFKTEKGKYVVLDKSDFEKADVKKTKTIEIIEFGEEKEIDPMYFFRPYYLEPEKSAQKAYSLLWMALKESKKVGLAKFILREQEHIAVIRADKDVLLLNQLRFNSEIKSSKDLKTLKLADVKKDELKIAIDFINRFTKKIDLTKYKDTYIDELKRITKEKGAGKVPVAKGEAPKITAEVDIMKQLKHSLASQKQHYGTRGI